MDLSTLTSKQITADKRRGFHVDFATDAERVGQLEKDLIGLFGEVGEFANVLKKVRLKITQSAYSGPSLSEATAGLREELADALIYLMRLSVILGGDLESDLISKMQKNDQRYSQLEP